MSFAPHTRPYYMKVLVIGGRISPADMPALCERAHVLLNCSKETIVCDVGGLVDPDAVAVEALARLQLAALRLGRHVRVVHAHEDLLELLDLMGLRDVVSIGVGSAREARGQAEEREQPGSVEKERDPGDLPI
jgi:ABC-type transporter Mla MlaB component